MQGVSLSFDCPIECGSLPEGVKPGQGGEGEGMIVDQVLAAHDHRKAPLLMELQSLGSAPGKQKKIKKGLIGT